ncbi:NAD(P)/FAD-dependent oxidoreductase [Wukongibacter sp. M2B1]|uniref:NAD(P)/FAD-dependent oxidoreductase n=1 Tax=Wukongibacter sp. M2B1 TaxID=3088895 RepID=UPI003D7B882B
MKYDIVVVGGGPAGLAAAIEAKHRGVDSILVIERDRELGGILQQCIHNGFGLHIFKEELTGPEYAERFIEELVEEGIEYKLNTMVLDITKERELRAVNSVDGFIRISAKAIILAMGCRERTRGAINIPGTRPSGVLTAGTAQRYINMEGYMVGKKVFILGSGDIGLIMARRMTLEGADVKAVAELMPYSGGLTRNIVQCLEDYDIPLLLNHTVIEIIGKERIEGVIVAKVDENRKPIKGSEKHYGCDTLLLSVGLIPENELSMSVGIQIDNITGGLVVNESMETSVEGIFGCGNVVHVHDLVDFVTEESRRAGKNAARFVKKELRNHGPIIETKAEKGISYIVPHKIRILNLEEKLDIFMRVNDIYMGAKIVVKSDKGIIKKFNRPHMTPGEMEHIVLDADILKENKVSKLSIYVESEGS